MNARVAQAPVDGCPVADRELDVTRMNCPLPILRTKAEIARMNIGEVLCVKYVRQEYVRELEMFSQQTGNRIVHTAVGSEYCSTWIQKGSSTA